MHQAEIQSTNAPLLTRVSLSFSHTHSLSFSLSLSLPLSHTRRIPLIFVIEESALPETVVFLCYIQNVNLEENALSTPVSGHIRSDRKRGTLSSNLSPCNLLELDTLRYYVRRQREKQNIRVTRVKKNREESVSRLIYIDICMLQAFLT